MTFNVLTFLIRKLVVKYEVKKTVKKKKVIKHKLYTAYKSYHFMSKTIKVHKSRINTCLVKKCLTCLANYHTMSSHNQSQHNLWQQDNLKDTESWHRYNRRYNIITLILEKKNSDSENFHIYTREKEF